MEAKKYDFEEIICTQKLLNDRKVNPINRKLFRKFFEYEEYKLKRTNDIKHLDDKTKLTFKAYSKNLGNLNRWFKNKDLNEITREDIKKVYDGLEEGTIKNKYGKPFSDGSRKDVYKKIFRSKFFSMIGKIDSAREVLEFTAKTSEKEVRFIREDTFKQIVSLTFKPEHKLIEWLAFDIGENLSTILKLKKKHFTPTVDEFSKQKIYHVFLPKQLIKRTRKERTELTNYEETAKLLDIALADLKPEDNLFQINYSSAQKFFKRAVIKAKAACIPHGQEVTWKDLRSSMACDLLSKRWTLEEINARLGHVPSSRQIDPYVNYLAIDKRTPQRKVYENNLSKLKEELENNKEQIKLQAMREQSTKRELEVMREQQQESEKKMFEHIKALTKDKMKTEVGIK